jgi:hypothetical protein
MLLTVAAREARAQAVAPEAALLASGTVDERFFHHCLAHHLGVAFVEGDVTLAAAARYPFSIHSGIASLDGPDGRRWLSAPRDAMLAELLGRARRGERFSAELAITTPSHMSRLLRAGATSTVLWEASLGLANLDPSLSAKTGASPAQCAFAMTVIGAASFAFGMAPAAALAVISLSRPCVCPPPTKPSSRRPAGYGQNPALNIALPLVRGELLVIFDVAGWRNAPNRYNPEHSAG